VVDRAGISIFLVRAGGSGFGRGPAVIASLTWTATGIGFVGGAGEKEQRQGGKKRDPNE
jgi:hypothetical protein